MHSDIVLTKLIKKVIVKSFLDYAENEGWVLANSGDFSITKEEKESLINDFVRLYK